MKPLLSIVIVNYNYGKYLENAILSVVNQKIDNYELLIIDGGSTDESIQIIERYVDDISYWVSEPDSGQSNAFNKGFRIARGEFFLWLNADDILLPNSLRVLEQYIVKYPNKLWFAGNTIFFADNYKILNCKYGPPWRRFLIKNSLIYVYGPSTVFHRSLFAEVNGFDESLFYTMDTDLWMRFTKKGHTFCRIKDYIWGFRIHQNSKTSHSFTSGFNEQFAKERLSIQEKNNWYYKRYKLIIQRLYKLVGGFFFRSYLDTRKYQGKNILDFDSFKDNQHEDSSYYTKPL